MPFMHLEDDITLDELARELAAIYRQDLAGEAP